ncbi:MAG TPA: PKD domain-containing protein [Thermoplasmata archaeon]|nr:PKD domain-containing protein [Thermoplasmata archaeon]
MASPEGSLLTVPTFAGLVVVLMVLGSLAIVPMPAGGPATLPGKAAGVSPATQLAWARSTLRAGEGPAHSAGASTFAAATPPNLGTWANITSKVGSGPSGRLTQMTWDAADGYVLLFGGVGCAGTCEPADTWTFANGVWTNITASLTGSPPAVYLSALAFDPSTNKVILFGGNHQGVTRAYTWAYSAKTWTNLSSTVGSTPPGRLLPAMTTDSTDGEIVMTGGVPAIPYNWDTWVFKGGTWTNVTGVAGAAGRLQVPEISDDPAGHGVLEGGSEQTATARSATLLYLGGTWHNLTSALSGPGPTIVAGQGAYVPASSTVVFYGGLSNNATGSNVATFETWEFANGAWTNATDLVGAPPTGAINFGFAVDPASSAVLLFGGERLSAPITSPYMYALVAPLTVTATVSKGVIDAGASVSFSASVTGGFTPNTVSWSFGDGTPTSSAASPTHTYSAAGQDVATVTVTSAIGGSGSASVSVVVNPALSVQPNVSASPTVGTPAYFASGLAGGSAPFSFAWTFGDGTSATTAAPETSHTFTKAATFVATLKVTDGTGANATRNVSVVVGSAPSTAVSLSSGTGLGLLLGIVVLLLVVVALAVMLMRKPKSPVMMAPSTVPPYMATPPPPPPSSGGDRPM